MASSATQTITGSAHIQALHNKTHHKPAAEKPAQGENFADLLAETGESQPQKPAQPKDKSAHAAHHATQGTKTETAQEAPEADAVRSEAADAALEAKAEPEALAEDAKPAANDNETSADLVLQTAMPQVQAKLKETATPPTSSAQDADATQDAVKAAALTPANDAAMSDAALEGDLDATGEAKGAPEFERALQDAKAEPRAASPEVAAPRPVEMKPAADIAGISLAGNTAPPGTEKTIHTSQAASQDLQAPLPTPDVNQFAVEVAAKSQAGARQFDIRLDPPELGRVDVRLSIDATGKAEAHLTTDQPATLDLLQKDASVLARALRDAGLNLAQDGLNFSLKSQQQQAGEDGSRHQGGRAAQQQRALNETAEIVAPVRHALGLLDIRV